MGAGKTKLISVRLEEELYKELEAQAKKRKEAVSQYVREVLYSFHYPTEEILKRLEENKSRLDYSIQNAGEYIDRLLNFSETLQEALEDFGRKVEGGAIQFPLMVSEKTQQEVKEAGKKVRYEKK
jgi:iron-sulfur cluster repair protein YtfE (RIC family)